MFLKKVLIGFGFHVKMVEWIMECVTTTSFSININGALHGYFKGKRGLRQGDPLSSYLFTMVMEILTLILRRRVQNSDNFQYHRYCEDLELINLCFVDDLFLFSHGDDKSAKVIMEALDEFKLTSGLVPSLPKKQRMRGFLWCQGKIRKGKSKVAGEVVCILKKEGGLGVKRLDIFNKALMSSHIWKLL
nr:putative RNA-directed DNA polymerase, eukaryota, reverse transcriptase zinc-binding domain protein [Tanacetum cinerariifolium]